MQFHSWEWLHRQKVGEFYRTDVLSLHRAHKKLVNKDLGDKEEKLDGGEKRWDFKVACGGLRIFLWQKVVDKEI